MHCAACEILLEKTLIKEKSVEMVDASLSDNSITIQHQAEDHLSLSYLNKLFKKDGYTFSSTPAANTAKSQTSPMSSLLTGVILIVAFLFLNKSGFTSLVSVNSSSSLPIFLLFGLLAGFSSCAALVGGIILSLSKQWLGRFGNHDNTTKKLEPHLLFNAGRLLGYTFFGATLGLVGNFFKLSPLFTASLVIVISVVMVILGLQMLGVKALAKFQFRLPKFITGKVADESNFQGRFAPVLMGALTFFLPCGFTITAQALALASGNPFQGALIMGLFALGTLPGLLAIGFSSVKLYSNPKLSAQFSTIAGMLVLFFAVFNANAQLNVLGLPNLTDVFAAQSSSTTSSSGKTPSADLVPLVNGQQIIKMDASSTGYTPKRFTIRAHTPTRWEIADKGTSGCTNAMISRGLFDGQVDFTPGAVAIKEFTSPAPGIYKFSCWMGMVSGVIEVVDSNGSSGTTSNAAPVESGAKGCGCGGGGGNSCGGVR